MLDLNAMLEEAKSDAALLRAGHLRLLQTLSERDQAVHEKGLAEQELRNSRDQVRLLLADRLLKFGAFEVSYDEQAAAFQHADQVEILPDEEAKVTRFRLLEGIALRELPKPPLAAVPPPAPDTSGTEPQGGIEPSPELGPGPHAVDQPERKDEPEPS
jgi:hypothetical protein